MTDTNRFEGPYFLLLRELPSRGRFGSRDRLGAANLIDDAARLRAARSVEMGRAISLSRRVEPGANARGDDRPGFALEVFPDAYGLMSFCTDHLELDCHGHGHTHIDAFNHIGLDDTWYGGWPEDQPDGRSIADFAAQGLITRGVLADIPSVRGNAMGEP